MFHRTIVTALAAAATLAALPAIAIQVCELNGQHVNPANGSTTAGKTGLMRCREGEGGPVVREQELQQGRFMGVVRYFKNGELEREHRVNERGNRDGLAREYAPGEAGAKAVLIREETYRDGKTIGLARSWHPNGQLRRASFHGDDDRERASVEFTREGQLAELRCAPRPVLAPAFDDARACGHAGAVSALVFHGAKGQPKARAWLERGETLKSETLWDSGTVREQSETTPTGGVSRSFAADGVKRRETQWLKTAGEPPRRVTTLEQEFHESGKLVRERRWQPGERGGELLSERLWYLNGQPKALTEHSKTEAGVLRRETAFHDNGRKASEADWLADAAGSRRGERPTGTHRSYDADGQLRAERVHDGRGKVTRERELDARGAVVRDDEVFEDGSRKAFGR